MAQRTRRLSLASVMIGALLIADRALAADLFVATTGVDAASTCASSASPCRTIGQALLHASSGDVVKVARGSYREFLSFEQPLAVRLSGGWTPDFASRDPHRNVTTLRKGKAAPGERPPLVRVLALTPLGAAIDLVIDGFTLGPNDASAIAASSSGGTTVKIELVDSVVRRLASAAPAVTAWSGGSVELSVLRSRIVDNRPRSRSQGGAIGVTAHEAGTVVASLVNSLVAGNRTREPQGMIDGWASGAGAHVDLTIRHSTVTSFHGVGVRLGEYFAGTTTATIASSIVWWNGREAGSALRLEGHLDGNVTVNASDNLLGARAVGFGMTFNDLGNNVDADPLFAQPRRSYLLRADSPAVDAVSCTLAPPTDLDGDPRPSGSACDLGADERVP